MGRLSDHYDPNYTPGEGGGTYLPPGKHKVRVVSFEVVTAKTGTKGPKFQFESVDGLEAHETFWLTPKSYKRLASFAIACGMSENELALYDADAPNDHAKLVNRVVVIDWQLQPNSDKYHQVVGWEPAGEGTLIDMPKEPMQPVPDDDIPF